MSYAPQAYARYKTTAVQTSSPERLLIMLYDGLIQKIVRSKNYIESGSLSEAHEELVKCQDIVLELRSTLKMEYEISKNLAALYDWFNRKLVEANVQKSAQALDDILPQVQQLREAWVLAAEQVRKSAPAVQEG